MHACNQQQQQQVEATKRAGKEAETQAARVQQQLELEKASLVARVDSLTQDVQSKAAALSSVSSSAGEREAALAVEVATLQGQVKEAREKLAEGGQWKLQLDQLQATMDKEQVCQCASTMSPLCCGFLGLFWLPCGAVVFLNRRITWWLNRKLPPF